MGNDQVPVNPYNIPRKNYLASDIRGNNRSLLAGGFTAEQSIALSEWLQDILNMRAVDERQNYNVIETGLQQLLPRRGVATGGATTATGVLTTIPWGTVISQDETFFVATSAIIHCVKTGWYLGILTVNFLTGAGNHRSLYTLGTLTNKEPPVGGGLDTNLCGVKLIHKNAGDTMSCAVIQDSGGNLAHTARLELMLIEAEV